MPAYSFKDRFADLVESGEKRQTIRPVRKRPTVPGDTLFLYRGMRTKQCRRLRLAWHYPDDWVKCKAVLPIQFMSDGIYVGGRCLTHGEAEALAFADGFENRNAMVAWFSFQYLDLPNANLELIEW